MGFRLLPVGSRSIELIGFPDSRVRWTKKKMKPEVSL